MPSIEVLRLDRSSEWTAVLSRAGQHDFYHLPEYHALAEENGEGEANLFVFTEGAYTIALPLLLRPLAAVPAFQGLGPVWKDATSVYGYPGPIASHAEVPEAVVKHFQSALREWLSDFRVVAVFSRLHPLIPHQGLLAQLGECKVLAQTVSIDLTLPLEVQRANFRRNHKEGINRLHRAGVTCIHDPQAFYLDEFIALYHETMRRVGAISTYYFPADYFAGLKARLGDGVNLFVCLQEGRVISGGLFIACDGILQYHLGGTLDECLKLAPMKLLVDEVRKWGTAQGLRVFHLGGGATPHPEDSLLHFKVGFSDRRHDFAIWRWALYPTFYQQLCQEKIIWNERHSQRLTANDFFPSYRCPTVPLA